jgi:hypothetical protein
MDGLQSLFWRKVGKEKNPGKNGNRSEEIRQKSRMVRKACFGGRLKKIRTLERTGTKAKKFGKKIGGEGGERESSWNLGVLRRRNTE